MSLAKTNSDRSPQDLSHLIFQCGEVGELMTLSCVPVVAGDSFQDTINGSFKLSPMRRNLSLDPKVEIFSFYVPHRHIYGDKWIEFIKKGMGDGVTPNLLTGHQELIPFQLERLAIGWEKDWNHSGDRKMKVADWRALGFEKIYTNYFARPNKPYHITNLGRLSHLKNIWSCKPNLNSLTPDVGIEENNLNLVTLQKQAAIYNNAQQRDHFATRYRDLIDAFGGHTTADVDQRPTLLSHTEFWGSGYDVDGTSETSLGQYTGRVAASFQHNIPRFFCAEHGAIWTVAAVRFPPIATAEAHYLATGESLSYDDFACDPIVVASEGIVEKDYTKFFPGAAGNFVNQPKQKVVHSQWYREHPSFVSHRYSYLQGYPFLEELVGASDDPFASGHNYKDLFQTDQLRQWQINARSNAVAIRTIPTSRQTFMLDPNA